MGVFFFLPHKYVKWTFPHHIAKHLPERDRRVDLTIQQHHTALLDAMESYVVDSWRSVCFWFSEWARIHPDTSELTPNVPSWVEVFIRKKSRLFLSHFVALL